MSTLKTISPAQAADLVRRGAVLIDVRDADEYARERIPGARHHSLSQIRSQTPVGPGDQTVVFHCRSGARTAGNAALLEAAAAGCEAYLLEGGLDAWRKAGLPLTIDRRQPLELMRQVQIAAGSLILMGVVIGTLVAPIGYALSAFVGAGLLFAGLSGFCGMARLLALMPWNRHAAAHR
jgi:rhodanese-related sulfurtransferase